MPQNFTAGQHEMHHFSTRVSARNVEIKLGPFAENLISPYDFTKTQPLKTSSVAITTFLGCQIP